MIFWRSGEISSPVHTFHFSTDFRVVGFNIFCCSGGTHRASPLWRCPGSWAPLATTAQIVEKCTENLRLDELDDHLQFRVVGGRARDLGLHGLQLKLHFGDPLVSACDSLLSGLDLRTRLCEFLLGSCPSAATQPSRLPARRYDSAARRSGR